MPLITLSIGSNRNPYSNVRRAVGLLREQFINLHCSTVYESSAVGFKGDNFLNLVAYTNVDAPLVEINCFLKELENHLERDRSQPRFSARPMDIDILTWGMVTGKVDGVVLPRAEILKHAFVLKPLADLLPQECHPESKKSYTQLWQELGVRFEAEGQKLWPIEFNWQFSINQ
ncbi:MAG: 2-amino-4-hydroxy-6-hydroxymethyldihydropteridine diphosphokinase [Gammaproteobacteria bacterium]|nr:2-amino-4-hydroxy-6-hydroxymethyldihydropteridine diphosphokinase [Gammaproteobacteria bacterium]MCY4357734.1 2-amino-4-hydroxy-6-hydroxymethyldihydropteridine diphosphokinase [Gammaproteobacteria bacterium]